MLRGANPNRKTCKYGLQAKTVLRFEPLHILASSTTLLDCLDYRPRHYCGIRRQRQGTFSAAFPPYRAGKSNSVKADISKDEKYNYEKLMFYFYITVESAVAARLFVVGGK